MMKFTTNLLHYNTACYTALTHVQTLQYTVYVEIFTVCKFHCEVSKHFRDYIFADHYIFQAFCGFHTCSGMAAKDLTHYLQPRNDRLGLPSSISQATIDSVNKEY